MGIFKKTKSKKNIKEKVICPYCKNQLEEKPKRKKKCQFCNKYIYVRNNNLVVEEEAKIIDAIKDFLYKLNLNEKDLISHTVKLRNKFNQEPSIFDVINSIFNELIIKKRSDLQYLKSLYYQMAWFKFKTKRDFLDVMKQSKKMELMDHKKNGVTEVELSGGSCPSCKELEGKIFMIDEALKQSPIPNPNCTHVIPGYKKPFCRCMYYSTSEIERKLREEYSS